jgi:amino acid transporter
MLLRPFALTAVIFFTVSGGPYGLEPVLNLVGSRLALVLVFVTPILWCIPAILMVLELGGMMPKNGGYYQWVRSGLGPRWGFFEGWWTLLFMFVDLAIYPVLFVQYASFFFPAITAWRYPVCLAMVWTGAGLNLLGILPVGRSSVAFGTAVVIPFAVLYAFAFGNGSAPSLASPPPAGAPPLASFGMGLVAVMWNYLGWDNASTFAEEVDRPSRSYLVAISIAFMLILAMYALTLLATISSSMDPAILERDGYPSLGFHLGGARLAGLLSLGGIASAAGLFISSFLSVSRLPRAMADDGLFPAWLRRMNPSRHVPTASILLCASLVSVMVAWEFEDLLIMDVMLYGCALFLEFLSLIALRRLLPAAHRPFRIPLSRAGLIAMTFVPFTCFLAALISLALDPSTRTGALLFGVGAVASAPFAWMVASRVASSSGKEPAT